MQTILNTLLRRLREHAFPKDSAATVAEKLGISRAYLSKVERGDISRPQPETFAKICELYGVPESVRKDLLQLYEAAESGMLPVDNPIELNLSFGFHFNLVKEYPCRYLIADSLSIPLGLDLYNGELPETHEFAIYPKAIVSLFFNEGYTDPLSPDTIPHFYKRLLEPRPRFFVIKEDVSDAYKSVSYISTEEVTRIAVDDICIVKDPYGQSLVTAQDEHIENFDNAFTAARKESLSGEDAVKYCEMMRQSALAFRRNVKLMKKWTVETKGTKVIVKAP